jgi:hypothetical protein
LNTLVHGIGYAFSKSIEQGAATTIFGVISNDVKGGEYLSDCQVEPSSEFSCDTSFGAKLWDLSEKLTNCVYTEMVDNVISEK